MPRVGNIHCIMIKRRQGADYAHHHGHGMGVPSKAGVKPGELLVHHRMLLDGVVESLLLLAGGQFPVDKEVAYFHEIALHRQLFDRVAAVKQNPLIAVDKSYPRAAAGSGKKARIIRKYTSPGM